MFEHTGTRPGKTLLVTAGMDGDEYTGIEAVYALHKKYKTRDFAGRLILIPIVNIEGFKAETSKNPVDNKYPKFVFPGKAHGTATDQLMHWLTETYAFHADCWVDLHAGALTETIPTPFVWVYTTGIETVDARTAAWLATNPAAFVVQETARGSEQAVILANHNCAHVLTEAGGRGTREAHMVAQQVAWTESVMQQYGMIPPATYRATAPSTIFTHVEKVHAPQNGLFTPTHQGSTITEGEELGVYRNYTDTLTESVQAPRSGTVLWRKETMSLRKGDTIAGIAY